MADIDVSGWLTIVSAVGNVGGLSLLVFLFSTNRIRTRGQHDAELARERADHKQSVEDLNTYHATLLGVKDAAYAELKESRDGYKVATQIERQRADKVTGSLAEVAGLVELNVHLLKSLDEVAKDSKP